MTANLDPFVATFSLPPEIGTNTPPSNEIKFDTESQSLQPIHEDIIALGELQDLLRSHDLWLGFSPIKGWVLLDRKHKKYDAFNRPFLLLRDGSIDFLSKEEFSCDGGPWSLSYWGNLNSEMMQVSGSATAQLSEIREYVTKTRAERDKEIRAKEENNKERSQERETNICNEPFHYDPRLAPEISYQMQLALAKSKYYFAALPKRIAWLRQSAKRIQQGNVGLEPEWSLGQKAAQYLREQGILNLWHFTHEDNLPSIRKHGGLVSRAGLSVVGANETAFVSSEESRNRDAWLGRDRFIRLSFIPNSWFFHRVKSEPLYWLRFSLNVLSQGEVLYAEGNAVSSYVKLNKSLLSLEIDWKVATLLSGDYSNEVGPTRYASYRDQISNENLFNETKKALNSEILVNHFLPIEYCEGAFECRSGKKIAV